MAIVFTDIGCDKVLTVYLASGNLTLRLYTNNYTPVDTSQNNAFTDASGGNYAAITLDKNNWTVAANNDPSDGVYAQQTFTFNGPVDGNATIYGYFVTDANNAAVWAERFGNSFTPTNNGDNIKITPRVQMSNGTPA
jgi:hypothetical protein